MTEEEAAVSDHIVPTAKLCLEMHGALGATVAKKLIAEIERLTDLVDRCSARNVADADEIERLRKIIANAPHTITCDAIHRYGECDCWKAQLRGEEK